MAGDVNGAVDAHPHQSTSMLTSAGRDRVG